MTSAQSLIWHAAGCPPVDGAKGKLLKPQPARCVITGEREEMTAPAEKALGTNFVDQSLWACHSGRVGQAALWCCSGKGKDSPRMWAWLCAPGEDIGESVDKAPYRGLGLCLTNRSHTRPVINLLTNPPEGEWVCTIPQSGQKHVLPYARTNHGYGTWHVRMEDTTITSTPLAFKLVLLHVIALRRLGCSAEQIKDGLPPLKLDADRLAEWVRLKKPLDPYHAAPIIDLALWCATKPILEDTHDYPNP